MNELIESGSVSIEQYLSDNQKILFSGTINLEDFRARKEVLAQLHSIYQRLHTVITSVTEAIDAAETVQERSREFASDILQVGWKSQRKKKPTAPVKIETGLTRVNITSALCLDVIKVFTFDAVKQDGQLYYVEPAKHFAVRIAGQLLHGNIGNIYTNEHNPRKIRDCKFVTSCNRANCDYYHDPRVFQNSSDRRDFIATSWLYTPPDSGRFRPGNRRIGSRDSLDTDIVGVDAEEVSRFNDQVMHDLLCSLVMFHARRS